MPKDIVLVQDQWLTGIFGYDVYNLEIFKPLVPKPLNLGGVIEDVLQKRHVFVSAKIPLNEIGIVNTLEKRGFRLVNTEIFFVKRAFHTQRRYENAQIRLASPEDINAVSEIAGNSLIYSRFHLDPEISEHLAKLIKVRWAANYFSGNRGDAMIIGEYEGRVCGFLQLLYQDESCIIDLIAVSEAYRRKRVAADMISFAESYRVGVKKTLVGTQLENLRSIAFYQSQGFLFANAKYNLHYHGS